MTKTRPQLNSTRTQLKHELELRSNTDSNTT